MVQLTNCPNHEQLQDLAVGRLPDPPAGAFEEHLLHCEACAQQTAELRQADTFVAAMKRAAKVSREGTAEEQARLVGLMSSVSGLRAGEFGATVLSDVPRVASGTANDAEGLTRELSATWRAAVFDDEVGRLGGYRILKLLGAGGMGGVYLAEDVQLRRRVALKVMRPRAASAPGAAERFLREARAAAALRHDHVITIYQVGEDVGVPFLAMELLEGESLEDRLKREPILPVNEALHIGREMAEGLAAAHAKGLIHRDIKPANVWLETENHEGSRLAPRDDARERDSVLMGATANDSAGTALSPPVAERQGYLQGEHRVRAKLLDFGLARSSEAETQITSSGMIVGTPSYMAPEQASADEVDGRADLFSLGVVLYRMTTGRLPFPGRNVMEILKSLATVRPAAPSSLNPAVPSELSGLIERLLDKDREARPASALAVARQLVDMEETLRRMGTPARSSTFSTPEQAAVSSVIELVLPSDPLAQWKGNSQQRSKRTDRRAPSPKWVGLGLAALASVALLAVVIVSIKTKDGRVVEKKINVPGEVAEVSTTVKDGGKKKPGKARVVVPSLFDDLDPTAIPAEERFAWQPKELVAVLGSHRQRTWQGIASVALSGDGSIALAGGHDGKGLLVDVTNGKTLPTPIPHARCVGVSPDGAMLFWKQDDGPLGLMVRDGKVWKPREMSLPKAATVFVQPWDATFSLDGRWLATSILHEVLDEVPKYSTYVWDVSVDPPQRVVEMHGFKHPSFSPDGKRLAVIATQDGSYSLQVFDLGELPPKLHAVVPGMEFPRDYLFTARPRHGFLASGQLAVIDKAGLLAVWDVSTAEPKLTAKRDLSKADNGLFPIAVSLRPFRTGQDRILLFSEPGFQTWRLNGDAIELEFDLATTPSESGRHWQGFNIKDVGISADGRMLASTHLNGMVRLWEFTANGFREKHPIHPQPIFPAHGRRTIVMASDGKHFATSSEDGFQVWQLNGTTCQRLKCSDNKFQIDGPIGFVSPSQFTTVGNGTPHHWRIDGDRVVSMGPIPAWRSPVASNPDGLVIARLENPNGELAPTELSLWQTGVVPAQRLCSWSAAPQGQQLLRDARALSGVFAVSNDGRKLVTHDLASNDGQSNQMIRIWQRSLDANPPQEIIAFPAPAYVLQLALSSDGMRLAVADRSGSSLWKLDGNRAQQVWHNPGYGYSVAFTPDGQHVAACSGSGIHEDLAGGVTLFSLRGEIEHEWRFPFPPSDLAFAPDGRHLLTANSNGTVYVLRVIGDRQ